MTHLAKLTFKTVDRSAKRDPIISRRDKLVAGLKEQKLVHAAALICALPCNLILSHIISILYIFPVALH